MVKIRVLQPYKGAEGRVLPDEVYTVTEGRLRELESVRAVGRLVEVIEADLPPVQSMDFSAPTEERIIIGGMADIEVEQNDPTVKTSVVFVDETRKPKAAAPPKKQATSGTFACPHCERSDFASERARDTHVNRAHVAPAEE